MKTVSMLEFRNDAEKIIRQVQKGQRLVLTYRGKPVIRLEPVQERSPAEDDPFYKLYEHADSQGTALTNSEMDEIVYGR
ncbi:MAG: type II toxin-antitoxin system Phd/YefM family antitoxin [Gammaproteobacteria bacterium]